MTRLDLLKNKFKNMVLQFNHNNMRWNNQRSKLSNRKKTSINNQIKETQSYKKLKLNLLKKKNNCLYFNNRPNIYKMKEGNSVKNAIFKDLKWTRLNKTIVKQIVRDKLRYQNLNKNQS